MTTSTVFYSGELRTIATHTQSGNEIITDAPTDNHGKGETFSPTDLVATALASCMMTIMGIKSEDMDINCTGMRADVTKIMSATPRRIAEIIVDIHVPIALDVQSKKILEAAAHSCPVRHSLHSEVKQTISFHYPQS